MNKTFLASSMVMVVAAALGWWIVADPYSGPSHRKCLTQAPAAVESREPGPDAPTLIGPPREVVEFIGLGHVFDPTGEELELQNLLECVNPEYLPEPRLVVEDWLASAGEEASSPPDGLTWLLTRAYRLAVWKCVQLIAEMEPLMGTQWSSGNNQPESTLGKVFNPLTDETMEARPSDLP